MFLGAHMSIAGGLHRAIERIKKVKGTALQIFTKNQRQWHTPRISEKDIEKFLCKRDNWGPYPVFSHTSYLLNLASPDPRLWEKSVEELSQELERAASLGLKGVVTHPGSHRGKGIKEGIKRIAYAIDRAIEETSFSGDILLETTSGQGHSIGGRFEELAEVITLSNHPQRLKVCVDTAHIFAAGYPIKEDYFKVMEEIGVILGRDKIALFHLNDNYYPLGSRRDRHAHIGEGEIGIESFGELMRDKDLTHVPKIIETPKGKGMCFDMMNLDILRALCDEGI